MHVKCHPEPLLNPVSRGDWGEGGPRRDTGNNKALSKLITTHGDAPRDGACMIPYPTVPPAMPPGGPPPDRARLKRVLGGEVGAQNRSTQAQTAAKKKNKNGLNISFRNRQNSNTKSSKKNIKATATAKIRQKCAQGHTLGHTGASLYFLIRLAT